MTLEEVRVYHSNTYFSQIGVWGRDLTKEQAEELDLLPKTTPAPKSRKRASVTKKENNNKE